MKRAKAIKLIISPFNKSEGQYLQYSQAAEVHKFVCGHVRADNTGNNYKKEKNI